MCGFLGEFSFTNELSKKEEFSRLLSLSKHRGPDSTHTAEGEGYRLGFNRLALLDLSEAGDQPVKSPLGRYHLVFNGEIYNYKQLIVSHKLQGLRSTSDTEVVLHLLDEIGVLETLKVLNGMFAIAVVDLSSNSLFLARDFAGIKPCFYGIAKEGVVFASQFSQIYKHPFFKDNLEMRPEIIHEYFAFGYMPAPNTVYKNILQVNPGEMLKISREGYIETKIIKKFPREFVGPATLSPERLPSLLKNAVRLQLNADRSLAAFLSGGVDSTLISSYAKELRDHVQAFTLKIKDPDYNESQYAQKYAEYLGLDHQMVEVDTGKLLTLVDEHFAAFDEPFGDYSSIATYEVTKEAAKYHTAMLSGDGGDELLWGYPRMWELMRKSHWFKLPLLLRKNLLRITNRIGITHTYAPFRKNIETYWQEWHKKIPQSVLSDSFKVGFSSETKKLYTLNKNYSSEELQHFLRWNEFYGHLQRVLIKVDRTSMRNSLEVRIPLLDKKLITYCWQLIFPIKTQADLKKPLKEILQKKVPASLLMKEKKGFSVPVEQWLRQELREEVERLVLQKDLYGSQHFDQLPLKQFVQDFLDNKHQNGWGVWHVYAWQKWSERR